MAETDRLSETSYCAASGGAVILLAEKWGTRRAEMAEIVNLRQARKNRARAAKDARAAENRTRFGRAKAEKGGAEAERVRSETRLDGKKLEDDPGP
jgi:hypothetical protein